MLKEYLKEKIPIEKVRENKSLRILGNLINDPNLWHLNRRSVASAFFIGIFCAFIPVPFQMVIAAALAIPVRANLPLSVGLVWITNPLTMPPIFLFTYYVGRYLLNLPLDNLSFEWSSQWFLTNLWPFLLGCFVVGALIATVSYFVIHIVWRWQIRRNWRIRRTHRVSKL